MYFNIFFILLFLFLNIPFICSQSFPASSKKEYHLLKPTPGSMMRDMHTDRPDITESPYTVDAGHFQFEYDLFNIYRHPLGKSRSETDFLFLNGIAKVGLNNRVDFEVLFSAYQWHFPDFRSEKDNTTRRGIGDIGFRTKFNLIGNDVEDFGLAIMPSVLLPLNNPASENFYIPGISLIWAKTLPFNMEIGGQLEYFRLIDPATTEKNINEYWFTLEVGKDLGEQWGLFVEYVGILESEFNHSGNLNAGIIRKIHRNFHWDMAFNYGLNKNSHSCVFTGFSFRF